MAYSRREQLSCAISIAQHFFRRSFSLDKAKSVFKAAVDEAVDWGHERGFPIVVTRDPNGFWLVSATLSDAHGQFRAECYLISANDIRTTLDTAVSNVRADRKKAFAGKKPGHLAVSSIPGEAPSVKPICKYGDPLCPCPDGDLCHYEGENPMRPPERIAK